MLTSFRPSGESVVFTPYPEMRQVVRARPQLGPKSAGAVLSRRPMHVLGQIGIAVAIGIGLLPDDREVGEIVRGEAQLAPSIKFTLSPPAAIDPMRIHFIYLINAGGRLVW